MWEMKRGSHLYWYLFGFSVCIQKERDHVRARKSSLTSSPWIQWVTSPRHNCTILPKISVALLILVVKAWQRPWPCRSLNDDDCFLSEPESSELRTPWLDRNCNSLGVESWYFSRILTGSLFVGEIPSESEDGVTKDVKERLACPYLGTIVMTGYEPWNYLPMGYKAKALDGKALQATDIRCGSYKNSQP